MNGHCANCDAISRQALVAGDLGARHRVAAHSTTRRLSKTLPHHTSPPETQLHTALSHPSSAHVATLSGTANSRSTECQQSCIA